MVIMVNQTFDNLSCNLCNTSQLCSCDYIQMFLLICNCVSSCNYCILCIIKLSNDKLM